MTETSQTERAITGDLSELATTLADVVRGYKEMEDRAEPELLSVVASLKERHERDAAEILALLENVGGRPDDVGSAMGVVHQAVATARDWLGGLDANALVSIVDGEEYVLDTYQSAISQTNGAPEIHDVVLRQKEALETEIDALRVEASE